MLGSQCARLSRSSAPRQDPIGFLLAYALVEVVVAHYHRGGAATGEAFDEFDRESSILRRLGAMRVGVEAELFTQVPMQLL